MSRIELTDSSLDMFTKMSEGNSGALTALSELYKRSPEIDPQSALGPFGPILSLDNHGIYGSSIYILWNYKCGRDARKMCVLLRSVQLGIFPERNIQELAADQTREVNLSGDEWNELDAKVCGMLDGFQKPLNRLNGIVQETVRPHA